MGTPVRALCGKVWVPSRDPKRFPVCPECKEIYDSIWRTDRVSPAGNLRRWRPPPRCCWLT